MLVTVITTINRNKTKLETIRNEPFVHQQWNEKYSRRLYLIVSSVNGARKTVYLHGKEWKQTSLIPYTKITLKWIEDLNVRPVNVRQCKLSRRKHKGKSHEIGVDNDFLDIIPKAKATKI